MKSVEFYCKSCEYTGMEKEFGGEVVCPKCGGEDVVLASVWQQFKSRQSRNRQPAEETQPG